MPEHRRRRKEEKRAKRCGETKAEAKAERASRLKERKGGRGGQSWGTVSVLSMLRYPSQIRKLSDCLDGTDRCRGRSSQSGFAAAEKKQQGSRSAQWRGGGDSPHRRPAGLVWSEAYYSIEMAEPLSAAITVQKAPALPRCPGARQSFGGPNTAGRLHPSLNHHCRCLEDGSVRVPSAVRALWSDDREGCRAPQPPRRCITGLGTPRRPIVSPAPSHRIPIE